MKQDITFGSADRFEIAIAMIDDGSPLASRPKGYGFSLGQMRLTVRGFVLTAHDEGNGRQESVAWYLLPIFEWLADNWKHLFHEEHFPWPERTASAAATACHVALTRFLPNDTNSRFAVYDLVQRWWTRHALRAGAAGGLLPDVFLRRLGDGIELSWSGREADFAPPGYRFGLSAGAATLPVSDVAEPLWNALKWLGDNLAPPDDAAKVAVKVLKAKIEEVQATTSHEIRSIYLGHDLANRVERTFTKLGRPEMLDAPFEPDIPVVEHLTPAVAMFGGVTPNLTMRDVYTLSTILINHMASGNSDKLAPFVDLNVGFPVAPAHDEGYSLAQLLLEDLEIEPSDFIDVEAILKRLGVTILARSLQTRTIRGLALAGEGIAPVVVVNTSSPFSQSEAGRRFTLAHELCHILYDQSRAKRVSQVSGPWAPGGVEKRANAFAAMLLMPRNLLDRHRPAFHRWTPEHMSAIAATMQVSIGALSEHLYNLGYIDEVSREVFRQGNGFEMN